MKTRMALALPRHLAGFRDWLEGIVGALAHYVVDDADASADTQV
jgi:hypothetical protein